jgi:uncharacterized protein (TIGR02145 family)
MMKALFGCVLLCSSQLAVGKEWTMENLNVRTDGSYCYEDTELNCRRYGRLYTWAAAERACRSLEKGWRLPTDDDWRELARRHGGVFEDSADKGRSAYAALLAGGSSGFNALLGGDYDEGRYGRSEAHGFYWTKSRSGPEGMWFYNFGKGGRALYRQSGGNKNMAISVRCVRD